MARETINKNSHLIDVWKLFLPVAGSGRERERSGVDLVLGPPILGEPGSVCTQTYLVAGPLRSKVEARECRVVSANETSRGSLCRFASRPNTSSAACTRWVPVQPWDRTWTDADLYKKYGITKDEIRPSSSP